MATRIKPAMASAHPFDKFDPTEHPGNVYDKFCEFVDSFGYVYESLGRRAPTGTTDVPAWTELDKRRVFLGRCASRSLQLDYEDEVPSKVPPISYLDRH